MPVSPAVARYFDELLAREGEAVRHQYIQIAFRNGDRPQPNRCHDNVDRWCHEHMGSYPIRGWNIEAQLGPQTMFASHSLICSSHGRIYDITLKQPLRFLEHVGDPDLYDQVRREAEQCVWPPFAG